MGLITQVEESTDGSEWQWANNDTNIGVLKAKVKSLQDKTAEDDIYMRVLLHDLKNLKSSVGQAQLTVGLKKFITLEDYVQAIAKAQKRLLGMHERSKID